MKDFLLFHINDSLFPIGSFAHSFGLEGFVESGIVRDEGTLFEFMKSYILGSFLYSDLLGLKLAFKARNIAEIINLESLLIALNAPSELREANKKLGTRFVKNINLSSANINKLWEQYCKQSTHTLHCVAYGLFCACAGLPLNRALKAYLYAQSANLLTQGVKLIPLSQDSFLRLFTQLCPIFSEALKRLKSLDLRHLGQSFPHYDIISMRHTQQHSRLYMS